MELFHSDCIEGDSVILGEEESQHCIKVLRHRAGDEIFIIDGKGTLYRCRLESCSPKKAEARIIETTGNWGCHPYRLHMAVSPTKNIDRYEWFAEKACEIGVDTIIPVTGEHSERKVIKHQRLEKILISATKQSLKGKIPSLEETCTVREFIDRFSGDGDNPDGRAAGKDICKLIAYCFEDDGKPRISIREALGNIAGECPEIAVLIGPEGDFSKEEAALAIENGFIPVHLGPSRLRTETAALAAVMSVYSHFLL